MSTENVDTSVRIDPNEEITPQKKVILLTQWKEKVEAEIADYTTDRDKIMAAYKEQKDRFDKILSKKMKKIKKLDSVLNGRKKVLLDINKEIDIAVKAPSEPTQV
jgi:DNA-directed RNA polymerase specialized sigma54-like protein